MNDVESAEVREALHEFHQYLSDQLAPLLVENAMSVLLTRPPSLMGSAIQSWLRAQLGAQRDAVPVSDYLFHALSKVHAFGELELVDQPTLQQFLEDLGQELLMLCPEEDRELLRSNIAGLGEYSHDRTEPAVEVLHRQARASAAPAAEKSATTSPQAARDARRLELLLSRLSPIPDPSSEKPASASTDARRGLVSEVVAAAAASSTNNQELEQHLSKLREMGIPAETGPLFDALSDSLPGWGIANPDASSQPSSNSALEAMRKIISLGSDSNESSQRFQDMVHAGIRQFNEGVVARAAVIFEAAERLVASKTLSPTAVEAVREKGQELLDRERLRKLAESPEKHALLRRVLMFFPKLRPEGLLDELYSETHRDRRRLLMSLLQAHGEAARIASVERLGAAISGGGETEATFWKDLIHLLRTIPPADDGSVEHEIDLVSSISPQDEEELVMEAIDYLGEAKHEKSAAALVSYLQSFEEMLMGDVAGGPNRRRQVIALLNRTVSTLARMGISAGIVAALEHGLKDAPQLGDTRARLVALGSQDLSPYPKLVAKVLESLQASLPRKLIGRFVKTKEDTILHLVTALSGTPSPQVRTAFQELAKKFSDKKFGDAAKKALDGFGEEAPPAKPSSPGLSGDLELFGLPNLLQSLSGVDANGTLTLFDVDQNVMSTVRFSGGRVGECQTGMLRREAAIYQLFEKPSPGTFAFRSEGDADPTDEENPGLDVMSIIMEGVRRYDEFQRAVALVPDNAVLESAQPHASPVEDEPNEALVESVWERASAGVTAGELDAEFPVDAYRVRRLLAQWVESGALRPTATPAESSS